jgi:hypothetical protein
MNFNFGATKGASEAPKMLTAGIHTATFKGIKKETITTKAGDDMDVMQVTFNVKDFGEYKQNFFAPNSTERTEGQYGPNPSPMEHFLVIVRQILDALDPKFGQDIDAGNSPIEGSSFTQVVNSLKKLTTPYIDKEVQIKLLPQSNGYASMPTFPARIRTSRDGTVLGLGYATTIIAAKDLTLLPKEVTKIEAAKNAKPTNMSAPAKNDLLSGMTDLLDEGDKDDENDLPF